MYLEGASSLSVQLPLWKVSAPYCPDIYGPIYMPSCQNDTKS